jgi:benzoyl-CoA reductase/2-hydroxyglutaryl-CoA dehydratase subunit BcrC/BadD/HgdB
VYKRQPHYSPERVEFFGSQLNKLFSIVKQVLGVEVTREVWDKVMSNSNRFARAATQLFQYMMVDPMPFSTLELDLAL